MMTILSVCIILITFILIQVVGIGASKDYLYNPAAMDDVKMEDVQPVIEYVSPKKMEGETDGDYKKRLKHPPFLGEDVSNPRVVEFYAPWCGHCQHYKPEYIGIARGVNQVAPLEFHAVSCVAHADLCRDQDVHGYPTIKWFPGKGTGGDDLKPKVMKRGFKAKDILKDYLHVDPKLIDESLNDKSETVDKAKTLKEIMKEKILKQVKDEKRNTKINQTFHDAAKSFDFALRNGIFMSNDSLDKAQSSALKKWLDLVSKSIPSIMKTVKDDTESLKAHFNAAIQSEDKMLEYIGNHRASQKSESSKVISTLDNNWSSNCEKGKPGNGYTCGLWELFHVITIGSVEWNTMAAKDMRISTVDAADALRDYIEHFFACDECRKNFLIMYDACQFQRCDRLTSDISDAAKDDWKQLPLWLWETHNDVNVRLLAEDRKEKGLPKATAHEEQRVRWPSKANCPKCWLDGGGWNEEQVYKYLRTHYWRIDPLDSQGTQSKSDLYPLDGQGTQSKSDLYATSIVVPSMKGYVVASWAALCGVIGLFLHFHRRGKKGRSGKCE